MIPQIQDLFQLFRQFWPGQYRFHRQHRFQRNFSTALAIMDTSTPILTSSNNLHICNDPAASQPQFNAWRQVYFDELINQLGSKGIWVDCRVNRWRLWMNLNCECDPKDAQKHFINPVRVGNPTQANWYQLQTGVLMSHWQFLYLLPPFCFSLCNGFKFLTDIFNVKLFGQALPRPPAFLIFFSFSSFLSSRILV